MRILKMFIVMAVIFLHTHQAAGAKSFTDNGNGTVTDNDTGLIWQQEEGGSMDWEAALNHCEGLSLAGNSDWRLPNSKELQSLVDYTRYNPALDPAYFPGVDLWYYWSSTYLAANSSHAWGVLFSSGYVYHWSMLVNNNVRCVRGG